VSEQYAIEIQVDGWTAEAIGAVVMAKPLLAKRLLAQRAVAQRRAGEAGKGAGSSGRYGCDFHEPDSQLFRWNEPVVLHSPKDAL